MCVCVEQLRSEVQVEVDFRVFAFRHCKGVGVVGVVVVVCGGGA
jgi:predicted PilT family ATPase